MKAAAIIWVVLIIFLLVALGVFTWGDIFDTGRGLVGEVIETVNGTRTP